MHLYKSRWALAAARFLTLLGLAVWLGGLAFLGAAAAPAVFGVSRALGPQAVGAMLARFTPLTYICGALMLLGWLGERLRRGEIHAGNARLWWAQGACTIAMLSITLYLGRVVTPEINAMQRLTTLTTAKVRTSADRANAGALPQSASAYKARFDAAHNRYTQLTKLTMLLGAAALFLMCLRLSAAARWEEHSPHNASVTAKDDIFVSATLR